MYSIGRVVELVPGPDGLVPAPLPPANVLGCEHPSFMGTCSACQRRKLQARKAQEAECTRIAKERTSG